MNLQLLGQSCQQRASVLSFIPMMRKISICLGKKFKFHCLDFLSRHLRMKKLKKIGLLRNVLADVRILSRNRIVWILGLRHQ